MWNGLKLFRTIDLIPKVVRNTKKWAKNAQKEPRKEMNKEVKWAKMANKLFRTIDITIEMIRTTKHCPEMPKNEMMQNNTK